MDLREAEGKGGKRRGREGREEDGRGNGRYRAGMGDREYLRNETRSSIEKRRCTYKTTTISQNDLFRMLISRDETIPT